MGDECEKKQLEFYNMIHPKKYEDCCNAIDFRTDENKFYFQESRAKDRLEKGYPDHCALCMRSFIGDSNALVGQPFQLVDNFV